MSGDGCCCHDLERERSGASELEDAYAEAMGALNRVTAQRDAARDIAARLEGELARVESVVRASMASDDPDDAFLAVDFIFHILAASKYVTDPTYPVMHLASLTVDEVAAEFARFRANASGIQVHPDAVIAEGES